MKTPSITPFIRSAALLSRTGNTTGISFPGQTGFSYQVQYKNDRTDPNWTNVGGPVAGNNAVLTFNDTTTEGHRFYGAQVAQP